MHGAGSHEACIASVFSVHPQQDFYACMHARGPATGGAVDPGATMGISGNYRHSSPAAYRLAPIPYFTWLLLRHTTCHCVPFCELLSACLWRDYLEQERCLRVPRGGETTIISNTTMELRLVRMTPKRTNVGDTQHLLWLFNGWLYYRKGEMRR